MTTKYCSQELCRRSRGVFIPLQRHDLQVPMLSASISLAPTRHLLSTPLHHYLKRSTRIINTGATFQRQFPCLQYIHYTAPGRPSVTARRVSVINLSCSLHNISIATSPLKLEIKDKMADFEVVLKAKYPAKAHARRVVEYIRKKSPHATGTLYLEGQKTRMIEDNDEPMPFR